jgi:hypothetical protein
MIIRDTFLRAKRWQIFPVFLTILLSVFFIPSPPYEGGSTLPKSAVVLGVAISSISWLFLDGWLWSIAHFLNNLLPIEFRHNKRFFMIACLYPLIFIPISMTFFLNAKSSSLAWNANWLGGIFSASCMLYVIYLVSRNLVLIEDGQTGFRCAWMFFLLWFFPAGVWVVQPRINRLFAERRPIQSPSSGSFSHCRNCGKEVADLDVMGDVCGVPLKGKNFCQNCGLETNPSAEICIKCGVKLANSRGEGKGWFAALMLSLLVGGFGIDRFYLGYVGLGIIKLVSLGGCGIWQLTDFILIAKGKLKDANGNELVKK